MLQQIRKSLSSTIVFILLALLIASFAFFGVGSIVTQKGTTVVTVGGTQISANEVRNAFDDELTRIREQYGPGITTQDALKFGVHRQVLNQLVINAALDEEAGTLGLLGSDEEVRDMIRNMEYFYDLSGKFSEVTYQQTLMARRWSVAEFEDSLRVDIARRQLIEGLTETALIPEIMKNTLYDYRKESRKAEIATIPASAITDIPAPAEEELKAYYDANTTSFMAPEYRDLSFLILTPADFATADQFTDDALRDEYNRRFDEFSIPERRTFEVAIFRDQAQANELIERVGAGESFSAVAAEMTGATQEDLAGGPYSRDEMTNTYSDRAAEAVFTTPVGSITKPLETLVSWQVFNVTGDEPGNETPFEEVKEKLSQWLAEERGIDALYDTVNVVDNEIGAGASMAEIAEAIGIEPIHIDAVSINALTPEGDLVAEQKIYPYLQEAFQKNLDDEIDFPQHPDREEFYMIQVNKIIPPVVLPFEKVRDRVRQTLVAEKTLKRLGERARAAQAAAEAGGTLTEIAARYGGVRFETDSYVRDRVFTQRELSPDIASLMFSLKLGEVGVEQNARADGYVLVRVIDISKHQPDAGDFEYQSLETRLGDELKNDLFSQYQARLREDMDVEINDDLLNSIFEANFEDSGLTTGQ